MDKVQDIIGVIFDFNGTMFFDSDKHIKAWASYVEELTGKLPDKREIDKFILNKSGRQIMEHFLGYEISDDMLEQFSEEKEGIYRKFCSEDADNLKLAPGLESFLDYLSEHNIARTIATTASLSNVMYYFERFNLYRWFEPDKIVFHNKRLRDKPFPDLYLLACKMINKSPDRCLVFEDSVSGITASVNAGIKHIVAVKGDNPHLYTEGFDGINAVINDFTELNNTLEL